MKCLTAPRISFFYLQRQLEGRPLCFKFRLEKLRDFNVRIKFLMEKAVEEN